MLSSINYFSVNMPVAVQFVFSKNQINRKANKFNTSIEKHSVVINIRLIHKYFASGLTLQTIQSQRDEPILVQAFPSTFK